MPRKNIRPSGGASRARMLAISDCRLPICHEMKCRIMDNLPPITSIEQRKLMARRIDKAIESVMKMDIRLFDCEL